MYVYVTYQWCVEIVPLVSLTMPKTITKLSDITRCIHKVFIPHNCLKFGWSVSRLIWEKTQVEVEEILLSEIIILIGSQGHWKLLPFSIYQRASQLSHQNIMINSMQALIWLRKIYETSWRNISKFSLWLYCQTTIEWCTVAEHWPCNVNVADWNQDWALCLCDSLRAKNK